MFDRKQYELIDFGGNYRFERFGGRLVVRPCPVAVDPPASSEWLWDVRYESEGRPKWRRQDSREDWGLQHGQLQFQLKETPSGQVGIFPEQVDNWDYIQQKLAARPAAKVLNLFAYTGGSSLAAALAGAEVTHIDAAKSVVTWAKKNAALSGLASAPVRWIVEDAPKFVAREIKRGNRYDAIILDPPSYGHGPKKEPWKLTRDLIELLQDCKQLLSDHPAFFLLTCHTPGFGPPELSAALSTCLFGSCAAGVRTRDMTLCTADGRRLFAGHAAYWP